MPKRPAVSSTKKEAIFQLYNFLSPASISTIEDLKDGQILQKIIQDKFPLFSESFLANFDTTFNKSTVLNSETIDKIKVEVQDNYSDKPNCFEENNSKTEDNTVTRNKDFNDNKNQENISDISRCVVESVETYPAKNEDILLRFKYIQKFIDDCYEIQSEEIISYIKCTECELELMKVSLFVLCEIVKNLLKNNSEDLQTLFHLDVKYQVELEDLFKLFISERDKISKIEVEKLLYRSADASPFVTPRRTSLRHKEQKSISPATPNEDVFTNSPLKVYFESPHFQKEPVILMKEKKKRKDLENEIELHDEKFEKLQCKYSDMEKELIKKDDHIQKLKDQISELLGSYEALQLESNRLHEEKITLEKNVKYITDQVMYLSSREMELQKALDEKESLLEFRRKESRPSFSKEDKNILLQKIEALESENKHLKEVVESQDIKIFSYKQEIAEHLRKEVKQQKTSGNLNQSYEEKWLEMEQKRRAEEENMGRYIEMDHRDMSIKFMELLSEFKKKVEENKNIIEENKNLKDQLNNQDKKLNQKKRVHSASTISEQKKSMDVSKAPDIEKFRKSTNHFRNSAYCHLPDEPSEILNNSDNLNVCAEQSFVFQQPPLIPLPASLCEDGQLWKTYDHQISEDETNSVVLDNVKTDDEAIFLNQDNKYVLGNLNFTSFLNELKKITKNGAFQKVLQIFGKCKKEINGTNRSNFLDLQDLLKVITECVAVAVALNVEPSGSTVKDSGCMTDEIELCHEELTDKISAISLKYEIKLKECDAQLKKCNAQLKEYDAQLKEHDAQLKEHVERYNSLELKYQDLQLKLVQKNQILEEITSQYNQVRISLSNKTRKYCEAKEFLQGLLDSRKKQEFQISQIKEKAINSHRKKIELENNLKKLKLVTASLKEENNNLKLEVEQLKALQIKLEGEISELKAPVKKLKEISELKTMEMKSNKSDFPSASKASNNEVPNHVNIKSELHSSWQDESRLSGALHKYFPSTSRESNIGIPNYVNIKTELHSSWQDESGLSGVLHKNLSHYVSENEEDFSYYNSLDDIKKEFKEDRVHELRRRNSLWPMHLQSSYPLEADLNTAPENLYVHESEKVTEENLSKKRKFEDVIIEEPSTSSGFTTPSSKQASRRLLSTPKSLKMFIRNISRRRPAKPNL